MKHALLSTYRLPLRTLLATFLFGICTLFSSLEVRASHAMGADLSYECLPNGKYVFTLNFYRDCTGIAAPTSATLQFTSASCGQTFSVVLGPSTPFGVEVTPICPQRSSTCDTGTLPGVQRYVYSDTVTFPAQCNDWVASWTHCCRNPLITNLTSPSSQQMYLQTTINNSLGQCNSSPIFTALPVPYICDGQQMNYNHGVIDPDGDSLAFTFIQPMTANAAPIPYVAGYSLANPLTTTGPFVFDSKTGQFNFTPNGIQVAVFAVRVDEYRNGVLIGSTMRDIQLVVISCSNIIPTPSFIRNMAKGGLQTDSSALQVCPGDTLNFEIHGTDINAIDTLTMSTNISQAIPGATFSYTGVNPLVGTIEWAPVAADSGFHFFTVTVTDNACPIFGQQTFAYSIEVLGGTRLSGYNKACNTGDPILLGAFGGSQFSWAPNTGILSSNADSSKITVLPTTTTIYTVTSNLPGACDNQDTMTVKVVSDFTYDIQSDTVCKYEEAQIAANTEAAQGPYIYIWTPSDSLSDTSIANPTLTALQTTTYNVRMESKWGCRKSDSAHVIVTGEQPRITVEASNDRLCPFEPLDLTVFAAPGGCTISNSGCSAPTSTAVIGDQNSGSAFPSPLMTAYFGARTQLIYTASDLEDLGFRGGTISELSFFVRQKNSSTPLQDITISIACVSQAGVTNTFIEAGQVPVFGPANRSLFAGWNTFNIQDYDWDGVSNLLIDICYANPSPSGNDELASKSVPYNAMLYATAAGNGCGLAAGTPSTLRPDIRFTYCGRDLSTMTVDWQPSTGLSSTVVPNPHIAGLGSPVTYTVRVNDNGCVNDETIIIDIDTSKISVSDDVHLCLGDGTQLFSYPTGKPPREKLNCGANGTTITGPSTYYQVGSGTLTTTISPFRGFTEDCRTQIIYTVEDLFALGVEPGIITDFAFELATKVSTNAVQNFTISMGCTDEDEFNGTWLPGLTSVYYRPSRGSVVGWNFYDLDLPYDWDGTSNLVVEICWDNPNGLTLNGSDQMLYMATSGARMMQATGFNASGCSLPAGFAYNWIPNSQFAVAPPPGAFEVVWTPGNFLNDSVTWTPTVATPTVTTNYVASTISAYGCLLKDSVVVNVHQLLSTPSPDVEICLGETANLAIDGGITYLWSPPVGLNTVDSAAVLSSPHYTTVYTVRTTDEWGCHDTDQIRVSVNPLPILNVSGTQVTDFRVPVQLNATGAVNYVWNPASYLDNPFASDPICTPDYTTTYTVTGSDLNGCKSVATVMVIAESIDFIWVPTAFTPNLDGKNDAFQLYPNGNVELEEYMIFNRWGQMVYRGTSFKDTWDGTYKGEPLPMGTFAYLVLARDWLGEPLKYSGNVTLIR